MYVKNYNDWNNKKIKINQQETLHQCHDGQVWIMSLGVNIGSEIDGKGEIFARPVLVIKRCNMDTFIGVPLTKTKKNSKWYISCTVDSKVGSVNISQIRLFDQKRLLRLIEKINEEDFLKIKKAVRDIFE